MIRNRKEEGRVWIFLLNVIRKSPWHSKNRSTVVLNWKTPKSIVGFEHCLPRQNAVALPLVPPPSTVRQLSNMPYVLFLLRNKAGRTSLRLDCGKTESIIFLSRCHLFSFRREIRLRKCSLSFLAHIYFSQMILFATLFFLLLLFPDVIMHCKNMIEDFSLIISWHQVIWET